MKPTTEGSKGNFDMVCISFEKEKERKGLKVVQGASKNSIFNEDMNIKAEDSELRENNTLKTASGNIIKFEEKAFEILKRNRKLKEEKGNTIDFEERKQIINNNKKGQERGA